MNNAFLFDGDDKRLDRCPAPVLSPPNGAEFDISQTLQVGITRQGFTIVYKKWTSGDPPSAPTSITDGTAVSNSVVVTGATFLGVVAVAFDPAAVLQPSIPVSGTYLRYDLNA
jgi:hypothetical protein